MIKNVCTINEEHTNDLREAFEHRAKWFYLLIEEAERRGVDISFAREAIFKCGCLSGAKDLPRTNDLKVLAEAFLPEKVQKVFEMDVVTTEKELNVTFHYCPLVAAWQKLTGDELKIETLCDVAMDGDRGIVSQYDGFVYELGGTIAGGNDVCELKISKK